MMNENATPKKTAKFKPNIIDFLIVIVIIGAVIGIAFRAGIVDQVVKQSTAEPARISFLVENINNDSFNYFNAGDEFFNKTHGCYLGRLEEKPIELPAEKYITGIDGKMMLTYSPADPDNPSQNMRIDVRGKLLSSGVFSDEGFLLGGITYIAPGSEITIQSKNITVLATITDVERINTVG